MTSREKIIELLNQGRSQRSIAEELKTSRQRVKRILDSMEGTEDPYEPPATKIKSKGISLTGCRVSSVRPKISPLRLKIRSLPKGDIGFTPEQLAEEWGYPAERIVEYAKKMKARRAVEVAPDEWVVVIMNPESAKRFQS